MEAEVLTRGVTAIWETNNIAIIVLFLVSIGEACLIYILLHGLLKMKDVLLSLSNAITVLNERIKHD